MTNQEIRKLALSNGFRLKKQPHGGMGLNPYVYDFARAILANADQGASKANNKAGESNDEN